ncbi:MAG: GUN4 domain-containing protein [Xenococcaceae cyanobacterium]
MPPYWEYYLSVNPESHVMTENPRPYDAVLGAQEVPLSAAVLGGLESVKRRFASEVEQHRIAALYSALNYGQKGLELIIQALTDKSKQVEQTAFYLLLQKRTEPRVKQILQHYFPPLPSAVGLDYTHLYNLLIADKWQQADSETMFLMLKASHRLRESWLRPKDMDNFPCLDLCTIDKLWVLCSNGHFGFSVQKRILESIDGRVDDIENRFSDFVGWRKQGSWVKCSDLTFDLSAPKGHLPSTKVGVGRFYGFVDGVIACVVSRLNSCQL